MVIFHSYVNLPEGNPGCFFNHLAWASDWNADTLDTSCKQIRLARIWESLPDNGSGAPVPCLVGSCRFCPSLMWELRLSGQLAVYNFEGGPCLRCAARQTLRLWSLSGWWFQKHTSCLSDTSIKCNISWQVSRCSGHIPCTFAAILTDTSDRSAIHSRSPRSAY